MDANGMWSMAATRLEQRVWRPNALSIHVNGASDPQCGAVPQDQWIVNDGEQPDVGRA